MSPTIRKDETGVYIGAYPKINRGLFAYQIIFYFFIVLFSFSLPFVSAIKGMPMFFVFLLSIFSLICFWLALRLAYFWLRFSAITVGENSIKVERSFLGIRTMSKIIPLRECTVEIVKGIRETGSHKGFNEGMGIGEWDIVISSPNVTSKLFVRQTKVDANHIVSYLRKLRINSSKLLIKGETQLQGD